VLGGPGSGTVRPMTTDAPQRIAALRRSHDDLVRFVDDFDERLLGLGSGAADWTVAQVLAHLGSGAEIGHGTLRAALHGQPAPGPETRPPIWARWNALAPLDALTAFRQFDERFVEEYEALDAGSLESRQIDLGFLPAPVDVATAVTFRLSEHALHSWDVHVAFDDTAALAWYMVPFLTEHMARMAAWTGRAEGRAGRARIETEEPAQHLLLELGDGLTLGPDTNPALEAATTLRVPAEALVRLVAGRLKPGRTPATVVIDGQWSLDDLRAVFPGY